MYIDYIEVTTAEKTALIDRILDRPLWLHITDSENGDPTEYLGVPGVKISETVAVIANVGEMKNNYAATTAPSGTNDISGGYTVGSRWVDVIGSESYICIDSTEDTAVWSKTTVGTISEIVGLTDALSGKSSTSHNHSGIYEPADSDIQNHLSSTSNPHSTTASQVGLGSVDNTTDLNKPISTATQSALDDKSDTTHDHALVYEPINSNIQSHVSATDNPHSVTKAQIGLSSVDDTSDADKPISDDTQAALGLKADASHNHDLVYEPIDSAIQSHLSSTSNPHSVTASQLSLGNIDNTSDADKPISDDTQTALNDKAPIASPSFTGTVGVGVALPKSKLDVSGGVKIADDTDVASEDKLGTLRYKEESGFSYLDMCMRTAATTYTWVNIKTNSW